MPFPICINDTSSDRPRILSGSWKQTVRLHKKGDTDRKAQGLFFVASQARAAKEHGANDMMAAVVAGVVGSCVHPPGQAIKKKIDQGLRLPCSGDSAGSNPVGGVPVPS